MLNSTKITGVRRNAKSVLWGYSGGTIGTNFAAELQPKYAPELNIVGAAMGGLPANFKNVITNNNKKVGAGFIIAGILGVAKAFPEAKSILDKQLLPEKAEAVRQVEKQCVVPTVIQFAGKDAFANFKDGADILEIPRVRKILRSLKMGNKGVPKIPMYIYMARNDELLVYDDTAALVKKYCDKGATVQFVKESAGRHITVALTGAPAAMQYLIERFDGKTIEEKCTERTVVSSVLDAKARMVLGDIIKDITSALLGKKLGPDA